MTDPSDAAKKHANVTLTTGDDWPSGDLYYSILAGVSVPHDDVLVYVDGTQRGQSNEMTEWEVAKVQLSPGRHTVTWSYKYNPLGLDALPPIPVGRIGAAFLDDVYFLPEGVTIAPTPAVNGGTVGPTLSAVPTIKEGENPVPPTYSPESDSTDPPTFSPTINPVGDVVTGAPTLFPTQADTGEVTNLPTTPVPTVQVVTDSPSTTPNSWGYQFNSPTAIPSVAVYYDGFEQGTFPDDPEWSTAGDGVWELTSEQANSGVYSIRSPDLTSLKSGSSNVTLSLEDSDFEGGSLFFSVLASIELPIDIMMYYLDGELVGQLAPQLEFEALKIALGPGSHEVTFVYKFNPFDLDQVPPSTSSEHTGAVYIDDVYLVPFFDGFETGDFTGFDWKTSGVQTWMVDTSNPFEGEYSAHVRTEDIPSSGDYSQLDLEVTQETASFVQFYFYAPVEMPFENFDLWVDGVFLTGLSTDDETWTQAGAILSSGEHTVSWRLAKNPGGVPEDLLASITPSDYRTGEVWLDNVQLLPSTPSFVETWESGDFSANPWVLSGDAEWSITEDTKYEGSYSATIASEEIEENKGTSELSIDIITENGGLLEFQILTLIEGPFELATVSIDDIVVITYSSVVEDWTAGNVNIQPGKRRVTFSLVKNPGDIVAETITTLPSPDGREGRIWLDGVVFTAAAATRTAV